MSTKNKFILVFVLIGLGLIGYIVDESKNKTKIYGSRPIVSQKMEVKNSKSEISKKEETKNENQKFYRMGEKITLGGFVYTIKEVEATSIIKYPFGREKAGGNEIFYLVYFDIENMTGKTDVVLVDDFRLVDAFDRQFGPSAKASSALAMANKQDLLLSQLHPGIPKSTVTAFEIPRNAASNNGITLVIPEKGIFNTGKAVVIMPSVELCPKKRSKKNGKKLSRSCG